MVTNLLQAIQKYKNTSNTPDPIIAIPTRYPTHVCHPPTRDGYISWDVVDQMLDEEP